MNSANWNLVSAGPSLAHLRKEHLIDGPVVTVNRALGPCYEKGIEVHYAALADGPAGAWEKCGMELLWRPPTILWVTTRPVQQRVPVETNKIDARIKDKLIYKAGPDGVIRPYMEFPGPPVAKLWDQALPSCIGFRFMPWGQVEDVHETGRTRVAFTTVSAFMGILRFAPRTIRILCMDMKGSWIPGWTEEQCQKYEMERDKLDRWAHEKRAMEKQITEARAAGIRVELVTPEPVEAESLDGAIVH